MLTPYLSLIHIYFMKDMTQCLVPGKIQEDYPRTAEQLSSLCEPIINAQHYLAEVARVSREQK